MYRNRLVELLLLLDAKRHNQVDVEITLAKLQVALRNLSAVWRNKDAYYIVLDFVTQPVGFVLI